MEIEIKNFGPIDYLKFDLNKDIHLLYGKNAVGKSYAMALIYCLVKNFKQNQLELADIKYHIDSDNSSLIEFVNSNISTLEEYKTLNITKVFIDKQNEIFKKILLSDLQNSILNTFSTFNNLTNKYSKNNFEIIVSISKNERIIFFINKEGNLDLIYTNIQFLIQIQKDRDTNRYHIVESGLADYGFGTLNDIDFNVNINWHLYVSFIEINRNLNEIFYFPSGRSGLYQTFIAFAPMIAKLSQFRFQTKMKSIELPTFSEPVSDYFIDLSSVEKSNINTAFDGLISSLESQILKGDITIDNESKKIAFRPTGIDLELSLSESSSMISELSPLVVFLKHIINFKNGGSPHKTDDLELSGFGSKSSTEYNILFIEEPEAHLHPEIQVLLMELFAKFPTFKLKLFITSHSDYMFNKLNNMIIKNEIDEANVAVYHLVHKENGTVDNLDMQVTSEGINDENFQDITTQLYNERLNFLESHADL
jgi:predicted ATP-dependent endonuclease of OLD family